MDSISQYSNNSSNEEDVEEQSNCLPENFRTSGKIEIESKTIHNQSISSDNYSISSSRSSNISQIKVDFFNLESVGKDTDNTVDDSQSEQRTKMVTVKYENKTDIVEVPGSDYWNDVDTLIDVSTGKCRKLLMKNVTNVSDSYKRKATNYERNITYENSNSKNLKYSHNNNNRDSTVYDAHCDNNWKNGTQSQQNSTKTDKERKLYYVHPKISPHLLNRHSCTFKYPRDKFKKWNAHSGVINRIKWCVPMFSHLLGSVYMDGTAKIWNPWSVMDPCLRTITTHSKAVKDIDWSSTGKEILTCSYDRTVAYTDVEKGLTLRIFEHPGYVLCGKHHHGNPNLIITGTTDKVLCWDVREATEPVKTFDYKDAFGQVQDVMLSRDGSQLFASTTVVSRDSADRNIICWDFTHGVILSNQIYQERYMCTRLKLHPVENNFLVQSHANYIAIFSTNQPYKINRGKRFESHKLAGYSVGFDISPDGSTVISGSSDGKVYLYNYQSSRLARTLESGLDISMDIAIHPVLYSTVAVCGWDGQIVVLQ